MLAFGHCLPLAMFLSALVKHVAVRVRVCWFCHQSGGTDVVDLPADVLLPDMFDSIILAICLMLNWLKFPSWLHGSVSL